MLGNNIFVWNVRSLNSRARRDVVREFVSQERASVVCLVETKLDVLSPTLATDLMGSAFDYVCLPSDGASGGIVVAWARDSWSVSTTTCRQFSVTTNLEPSGSSGQSWSLAVVYGPVLEGRKPDFLAELRSVHAASNNALLITGDFNMIYQAADKNNDRLNLSSMRRFRRTLDALGVQELYLHGRLFTWSNERRRPTLERIDRAFASVQWLEDFADHRLRSLSSDSSDHAPLLLQLRTQPWAKPRFRFEAFWVRLDGFLDVVTEAWAHAPVNVDACRALDYKLRSTAKALRSWSMKNVGSVRLQLFMARELIAQLDAAQDSRLLTDEEWALRADLKRQSLGLASLARTTARNRARIRYLEEGDANTKFFHLQACHRSRKNYIPLLQHEGNWFSAEEAKADLIFDYYNGILGTSFQRQHAIHLDDLLPQLDLSGIDACFSKDEIWATVKDLPVDHAPGPDGFTGLFYRTAWNIIKQDVINAFNALWSLDAKKLLSSE